VFCAIGDQVSLREWMPPQEVLRMPEKLTRLDAMLDDPVFFAPFTPYFHPLIGRPSTSVEWLPAADVLEVPLPAGF
jgi:transposase, IS5 family